MLASATEKAQQISALEVVTIKSKAGDEGKLFGSIGTKDIADAVTLAGVEIVKSEVKLPEGVIRSTGDYDITLQLHSEVSENITLKVIAED